MATFQDPAPGEWIQCSYNTRGGVHYAANSHEPDGGIALRKNFPSIGWSYDAQRDAFIPPKTFASWKLNEDSCTWEPPVPYPSSGQWIWDEQAQNWQAAPMTLP